MHVFNHRILVIIEALVVVIVIQIILNLPQMCKVPSSATSYSCTSPRDPTAVLQSSVAEGSSLKVVVLTSGSTA